MIIYDCILNAYIWLYSEQPNIRFGSTLSRQRRVHIKIHFLHGCLMIMLSAQKIWCIFWLKFLNNGLEIRKDQSLPKPRNLSGLTREKIRSFRQDSRPRAWTWDLPNTEWDNRSYRIIPVSVQTRIATRNTIIFCPRRHAKLEKVFLTLYLKRPL